MPKGITSSKNIQLSQFLRVIPGIMLDFVPE